MRSAELGQPAGLYVANTFGDVYRVVCDALEVMGDKEEIGRLYDQVRVSPHDTVKLVPKLVKEAVDLVV